MTPRSRTFVCFCAAALLAAHASTSGESPRPGPRQPQSATPFGSLERVAQGEADVDDLAASLRQLQPDLRVPQQFEQVFRVPGRGGQPDRMARVSGAVTAVFPESQYRRTDRGTRADVPAGTVFYLGPVRERAEPAPSSPPAVSESGLLPASRAVRDRSRLASGAVEPFRSRANTRVPTALPTSEPVRPAPPASPEPARTEGDAPRLSRSDRLQLGLGQLTDSVRARLASTDPSEASFARGVDPSTAQPQGPQPAARIELPPELRRVSRVRERLAEALDAPRSPAR